MKIKINALILAATLLFVFGLVSTVAAQKAPPTTGGYNNANPEDDDVWDAAQFAVQQRASDQKLEIEFNGINKAQRQVVAGMNYKICMQVTISEPGTQGGEPETVWVEAVVYRNLQKEFKLTKCEERACNEE